MVVDAEAKLAQLAHLHESDGVLFKIKTPASPASAVHRRYSHDEFPQLPERGSPRCAAHDDDATVGDSACA